MPPPGPGRADMSYSSTDIFSAFASDMATNKENFETGTADAHNQATGASGQLSGSEGLLQQLVQASMLRKAFIEATSNGLTGYASAGTSLHTLHVQHATVTTAVMQKLMKLNTEGGK